MGKFDTIRRSQLIVPFGIGAMIELPDETLMTAGLDHWPSESSSHPIVKEAVLNDTLIRDERLEKRLTKLLFSDKDKKINFFLAPTEGKQINNSSSWKDKNQDMRFVRFPSWLHCKRCGILKKFDLDEKTPPRCENEYRDKAGNSKTCKDLKKFQKPIMKPVRFLIACKSGHIDDFPWKEWVHESPDPDCDGGSGELFFSSSGGGTGLSGVFVSCHKCKRKRSLAGANNKKVLIKYLPNNSCPGRSPWLGKDDGYEQCSIESEPQLVLRGQSSIYFPHILSSILIPPYSRAISVYLNKNRQFWDTISVLMEEDGLNIINDKPVLAPHVETLLKREASKLGFREEPFVETAVQKKLDQNKNIYTEDITDEQYKFKEYFEFISDNRPDKEDRNDFDIFPCDLNDYQDWIKNFFRRIVRVEKLRETRVFTGFSRIKPLKSGLEKIKISITQKSWLPAIEVRGEGIFFEFNMDLIKKWEKNFQAVGSGERLNKQIISNLDKGKPNYTLRDNVNDRFILVHTFAHSFINQLSFECGYDASSLKERIYVGKDNGQEMCGVLIYTASGDSEGSLGGLVERAKPSLLEETIKTGILEANTCSNDPICHETDRQGLEGFNVSACHSCCLLPETSCEHNNLLLDRRTLIGTFEDQTLGFFDELVKL